MSPNKIRTDGEHRPLSKHADVIINDTEDGVNIVIENRDNHTYHCMFNFAQSENVKLVPLGSTIVPDDMKAFVKVPGNGTRVELANFTLNSDDCKSILVKYNVRVQIEDAATGSMSVCRNAGGGQVDESAPKERKHLIDGAWDIVYKTTPRGKVAYLENIADPLKSQKSFAAMDLKIDFSDSKNIAALPNSTKVKQVHPMVLAVTVPACGSMARGDQIDLAELVFTGPGANIVAKLLDKKAAKDPSNAPKSVQGLEKALHSPGMHVGKGHDDGEWNFSKGSNNIDIQTDEWNFVGGDNNHLELDEWEYAEGGNNVNIGDNEWNFVEGDNNINKSAPNTKDLKMLKNDELRARVQIHNQRNIHVSELYKLKAESSCNICRLILPMDRSKLVKYQQYSLHPVCYANAEKCPICNKILVGEYVTVKCKKINIHKECIDEYKLNTRPSCFLCSKQIMDTKWGHENGRAFHLDCKK